MQKSIFSFGVSDLFKTLPVGDIVDKNNPLGPAIIGCSDVPEPEKNKLHKWKKNLSHHNLKLTDVTASQQFFSLLLLLSLLGVPLQF